MAIDLLPTGIAATALTALSRIAEAAIRKSASKRNGVSNHAMETRVLRLEGIIEQMQKKASYLDAEYRIDTLEVVARRHGWDIPFRVEAQGD